MYTNGGTDNGMGYTWLLNILLISTIIGDVNQRSSHLKMWTTGGFKVRILPAAYLSRHMCIRASIGTKCGGCLQLHFFTPMRILYTEYLLSLRYFIIYY